MGKYDVTPSRGSLPRSAKTKASLQLKKQALKAAAFRLRRNADHAYPDFPRSVSHRRNGMPASLTRRMLEEIIRKPKRTSEETKFLIANTFGKEREEKAAASSRKRSDQSRNHILADSAVASLHDAAAHPDMFEHVKQNFGPMKRWLSTLSNRMGETDDNGNEMLPDAAPYIEAFERAADDATRRYALKKAANAASMGLGNLRIANASRNMLILHGYDPEVTDQGVETEKTQANKASLYGLLAYARNSDGSAPSDAQKNFAELIFSVGRGDHVERVEIARQLEPVPDLVARDALNRRAGARHIPSEGLD